MLPVFREFTTQTQETFRSEYLATRMRGMRASQVSLVVKNPPAEARDKGWKDPLEKGIASHSSIPAWKISRAEEPGGLESMGELQTLT